jgi:hypothetical protein
LRILQYLIIRLEEVCSDTKSPPQEKLEMMQTAMFDVYDFDTTSIINMFHIQSSETLKNLSVSVLAELSSLSATAIALIEKIFAEGIAKGFFIQSPPPQLADTFWSLFSGVVLWEANKSIMERQKDSLKQALAFAFSLFNRGITNETGK